MGRNRLNVIIDNAVKKIIQLVIILLLMGCNNDENPIDKIAEDSSVQQNSESSMSLPSRSDFENLDN